MVLRVTTNLFIASINIGCNYIIEKIIEDYSIFVHMSGSSHEARQQTTEKLFLTNVYLLISVDIIL